MDINMTVEGIKMIGGIVIGKGIKNVVYKSLGWTVGEFAKPLDRAVTAIGVYAIGYGASKAICNMVDDALDNIAETVIKIQDKIEEAKNDGLFCDGEEDELPDELRDMNDEEGF